MNPEKRRSGFTLIELLLVIAIIALLASLLLGSLSAAKAQAYRIVCIGNHRQLALIWQLYQDDNDGKVALNRWGRTGGNPPTWVGSTIHGQSAGFVDPNFLTDRALAAFAPYLKTLAIYKCPAETGLYQPFGQKAVPKIRSYSMNDLITPAPGDAALEPPLSRALLVKGLFRSSDFLSPASTFVFIDVEPASMCYATFHVPNHDVNQWFHAPGAMHAKRGVLSFADGHVEHHKWIKPNTRKAPNPGGAPHPPPTHRGDMAWLRQRAHHEVKP